jgi:hypothetical protein
MACGAGGLACQQCSGLQICLFGGCYDVTNSCGPQSCSGCCSQGACLAGTDAQACGINGNACQTCNTLLGCVQGQCFSLGGGGGDAGVGDPCMADSDCRGGNDPFFGQGTCIVPTTPDGGSSGWPGGYCSPSCYFLACPSGGLCVSSYCYESCPQPGGGRSTCRQGYVCTQNTDADGGVIAGPGFCQPDCHDQGDMCINGTQCNAQGYCK